MERDKTLQGMEAENEFKRKEGMKLLDDPKIS